MMGNTGRNGPTEDEIRQMKAKAESGNPLYMFEYGKTMIGKDPETSLEFLKKAASLGITDALMIIANHYEKAGDVKSALMYAVEASRYNADLAVQIGVAIGKHGDEEVLENYMSMLESNSSDQSWNVHASILAYSYLGSVVGKNPQRFPHGAELASECNSRAETLIDSMLRDGSWKDKDVADHIKAVNGLLVTKGAEFGLRLEHLQTYGTEPMDLELVTKLEELSHGLENPEDVRRIEEIAAESRLPPSCVHHLEGCVRRRYEWVAAMTSEKLPQDLPFKKDNGRGADWDDRSSLVPVGRLYFTMGSAYHFLARLMFTEAARAGDAEGMYWLGYMACKGLGERECSETFSGIDYVDTVYTVYRPGSEKTGVEWFEASARAGNQEAREYLERLSEGMDLEARQAIHRLDCWKYRPV